MFTKIVLKNMAKRILWFEDKLGVTDGYMPIWTGLMAASKLPNGFSLLSIDFIRASCYKSLNSLGLQFLVKQGNRIQPGFNPDESVQHRLTSWVMESIKRADPIMCISTDPALGFLANPDWSQATSDNLRGGVYEVANRPWLCTLPISAWHQKKSSKDIAKLNEGYTNKQDWEEDREEDEEDDSDAKENFWMEPYTVPEGKFVLRADMMKAARITYRILHEKGEA